MGYIQHRGVWFYQKLHVFLLIFLFLSSAIGLVSWLLWAPLLVFGKNTPRTHASPDCAERRYLWDLKPRIDGAVSGGHRRRMTTINKLCLNHVLFTGGCGGLLVFL